MCVVCGCDCCVCVCSASCAEKIRGSQADGATTGYNNQDVGVVSAAAHLPLQPFLTVWGQNTGVLARAVQHVACKHARG